MTYLQDIEQRNGLSNTLLNINDIQSFAQLPLAVPSMVVGGGSFLNSSASMIPQLNKSHYFPALENKLVQVNRGIDRRLPFFKPLAQTIEAWEAPLIGTIFASKLYDTYKQNKALASNRRFALPIAQAQGYDPAVIQEYSNIAITNFQGIKARTPLIGGLPANTEQTMALSTRSLASYNQFAGALSNVNTVLKLAPDRLKEYGKSIRELTEKDLKNSVKSVEALAAAYEAASAGFTKAKDNQSVMVAGLKLAKAGAADSGEVMRLLTQTMNTYGASAKEASTYAAKFNNIVEKGITTVSELSSTLGETAVVAKSAGVNIDEVGAAIATMTTKGMGTAEANTALQGVLMTVIDKTPISSKTIRELNKGITKEEDKIKLDSYTISNDKDGKGLIKELQKINKATKGNATLAADVFTSIQAYKGYTTLMNDKGKTLDDNFASMKATVSSNLDKVFGIRIDNQNEKFNKIFNRIEESYTKMGSKVEPFFDKSITSLENFVDKITATSEKWSDILPTILKMKSAVENFVGALTNVTKTIVGGLLLYNMARMGGLMQSIMSSFSYVKAGKEVTGQGLGARLMTASREVLGINQLQGKMIDTSLDENGMMMGGMKASESAMYNRFRMSQARDYITTWLPDPIRGAVEGIGKVGSKVLDSTGLFGTRFRTEKRPDIFVDKDGDLIRVNPNLIDSSTGTMRAYNVRPELLSEKEVERRIREIDNTDKAQKVRAIQEQNTLLTNLNTVKDQSLASKAQTALSPNDPAYITAQQQIDTLQNTIATKQGEITSYNSQLTGLNTNAHRDILVQEQQANKAERTKFKTDNQSIRSIEEDIKQVDKKIAKEQTKANPNVNKLNALQAEKTNLETKLANEIAQVNPNYYADKAKHERNKVQRDNIKRDIENIDNNTAQQKTQIESKIDQTKQEITQLEDQKRVQEKIIAPTTYTRGIGDRVFLYDKEGGLVEDVNNQKYSSNLDNLKTRTSQFKETYREYKVNQQKIADIDKELSNTNLPQANKDELERQKKEIQEKQKQLIETRKANATELKKLADERKTIKTQSPLIDQTPYATTLATDETDENKQRRQLAQDNLDKEQKRIQAEKDIAQGKIPSNLRPVYTGIGRVEYKQLDADTQATKYAEETPESKKYREQTEKIERQLYGNKADNTIVSSSSSTVRQREQAQQRLEEQVSLAKRRQASASPLTLMNANLMGMLGRDFGEIEEGRLSNAKTPISNMAIDQFQQSYVKLPDGSIIQATPEQARSLGGKALSWQEAQQELHNQEMAKYAQRKQQLVASGLTEEQVNERIAKRQARKMDARAVQQWVAQENDRTGGNMTYREAKRYLENTGQGLQVDSLGRVTAIGAGAYNAKTFAGKMGAGLRNTLGASGIGSMLALGGLFYVGGKVAEAVADITPWGVYGKDSKDYDLMEKNLTQGLDNKEEVLNKQLTELIEKNKRFEKYIKENNRGLVLGTNNLAKEELNKKLKEKQNKLGSVKGEDRQKLIKEIQELQTQLQNSNEDNNILLNKAYKTNNAVALSKEITTSEKAVDQVSKEIIATKEKISKLDDSASKSLRRKLSDLEEQKNKEEELLRIKKDYLALLKGEEVSQQTISKTLASRFSDAQPDAYNSDIKKGQLSGLGSLSGNGFSNLGVTTGMGALGVYGGLLLGSLLGVGATFATGGAAAPAVGTGLLSLASAVGGGYAGLSSAKGIQEYQTDGRLSIYDVDKYAQEFGILDEKGKRVRQKDFVEGAADNVGDFLKSIGGDNSGRFEEFFNRGIVSLNKGIKSTDKLTNLYEKQTYGQLIGYSENPLYKEVMPLTEREEQIVSDSAKGIKPEMDWQQGLVSGAKGAIGGAVGGALAGATFGAGIGALGGPIGVGVGAGLGALVGSVGAGLGYFLKDSTVSKQEIALAKARKAEYDKYKNVPQFLADPELSATLQNQSIFNRGLSTMSDQDITTMQTSIENYNLEARADLNKGLGKKIAQDKANLDSAEAKYESLKKDPKSSQESLQAAREVLDYERGIADKNDKILQDKLKYEQASKSKLEEIQAFYVQYKRNQKGVKYLGIAELEENRENLTDLKNIEDRIETSARDFTKPITESDITSLMAKDNISREVAQEKLITKKNEAMGLLSEEYNSKVNSILQSGQSLYESGQWSAKQYSQQITELLDQKDFKYLDTNIRSGLVMQKAQLIEEQAQEKTNILDLDNQILQKKYETGNITQLDFETESIKNQYKATQELISAKEKALQLIIDTGKISKEKQEEAKKEIDLLKQEAKAIKEKGVNLIAVNNIAKKQADQSINQSIFNSNFSLTGLTEFTQKGFLKSIKEQEGIDKDTIKLKEQDYIKQVNKTGKDSLEAKNLLAELTQLKEQSITNYIDSADRASQMYNTESEKYYWQNSIADNYEQFGISNNLEDQINNIDNAEYYEAQGINTKYKLLEEGNKSQGIVGLTEYQKQLKRQEEDGLKSKKLGNYYNLTDKIIKIKTNESEVIANKENNIQQLYGTLGIDNISELTEGLTEKRLNNEKETIDIKYKLIEESNKILNIKGLTEKQKENKQLEEESLAFNIVGNKIATKLNRNNSNINRLEQNYSLLDNYEQLGVDIPTEDKIGLVDRKLIEQDKNIKDKYELLKEANKSIGIIGLTDDQKESKKLEEEKIKFDKFNSIFTKANIITKPISDNVNFGNQELELLIADYQKGNMSLDKEIESSITSLLTNKRKEITERLNYIEGEFKSKGKELPANIKRQSIIEKKKQELEASQLRDQLKVIKGKPILDELGLRLQESQIKQDSLQDKVSIEEKRKDLKKYKRSLDSEDLNIATVPEYLNIERERVYQSFTLDKQIQESKEDTTSQENKKKLLEETYNTQLKEYSLKEASLKQERELEATTKSRKQEIENELNSYKDKKDILYQNLQLDKEALDIETQKQNKTTKELQARKEVLTLTEKSQKQLAKLSLNQENNSNKLNILESKENIIDNTMSLVENTFGDSGTSRKLMLTLLDAKEKSLERQYKLEEKIFELQQQSLIVEKESLKVSLELENKDLKEKRDKEQALGNTEKVKEYDQKIELNEYLLEAYQKQIENSKVLIIENKKLMEDNQLIKQIEIDGSRLGIQYTYEGSKKHANDIKNLVGDVSNEEDTPELQELPDFDTWKQNKYKEPNSNQSFFKQDKGVINIGKALDYTTNKLKEFEEQSLNFLESTLKNIGVKNIPTINNDNQKPQQVNKEINQKFEITVKVNGGADSSSKLGNNIAKAIEDSIGDLLTKAKTYKNQIV